LGVVEGARGALPLEVVQALVVVVEVALKVELENPGRVL
jgi:hypothetical protein